MQETLNKWIENPKRKYSEGLSLFEAYATDALKKKYGAFLKDKAKEGNDQFSIPMSILTNKLVQIRGMMKVNPDLFKDVKLISKKEDDPELEEKTELVKQLQSEIDKLKEELDDSEFDNEELKDELSEKESKLEELQAELAELESKRGLQIVPVKSLPKSLQKKYDRNREITPLMAAIHSEIANEATTVEKRKTLVDELCALDDERRANWDAIDDWAEGKPAESVSQPTESEKAFSEDPFVAGIQIARRIERLKENIKRSQDSAENGKSEKIRNNAVKRVEAYQAELTELEKWEPKKDEPDAE